MSDSILNDIVILLFIVILLITGPIYQNFETADTLVDSMAVDVINNYQKTIRKNGYVDQDTYLDLLKSLSMTKEVYEVKLIHTSRLVYPGDTDVSDYQIHEVKYGEDIILDTIKDGKTKYKMRYGDDFKIYIKETKVAPSRLLTSIFSQGKQQLISHNSGGMVENEGYE